MKHLLLALLLALGPSRAETAAPWAGVPLARLPELGLGAPALSEAASGWQAPIAAGGFVRFTVFPDEQAARDAFAFQRFSAASVALPDFTGLPGVQAAGDGAGLLLLRDRNVILLVRDPADHAIEVAGRLRAALVDQAPEAPGVERLVDGRVLRWDACGRLTITP